MSSERDTERALLDEERWVLETMPEEELAGLTELHQRKGLSPVGMWIWHPEAVSPPELGVPDISRPACSGGYWKRSWMNVRGIGRDCVMGKKIRVRGHRGLGLLAALAAVLLVPVTTQGAAAQPIPAISVATAGQVSEDTDGGQIATVDALRTSGILAAVALTTAAMVWLWWYLVLRRRS